MSTPTITATPHQVSPEEILVLLGLRELSVTITNQMDVAGLLERGLPKRCIGNLIDSTGITFKEMGVTMHIADRTLKSWGAHASRNQLLTPLLSAQLWLLAATFRQAQHVMGNARLALTWLRNRHIGLDSQRPLDLLKTPLGVDIVVNFLRLIDGGVYI